VTGSTAYTVNHLNEYPAVGGGSIGYDGNANLTSSNGQLFTYDAQNRLLSVTGAFNTAQLSYDAANRCVVRTINGGTRYLYYDGWDLVEERDASGNLIANYIHGPGSDEMLARIGTSGTVYYHQNALGSTTGLTDSSGNLVERYQYDVYGRPTIYDGSGNVVPGGSLYGNRFLFTGREWLQEVSLYDYRNRVYSADLGRFLQTDPMSFAAGDWNLYRYVGNGVTMFGDPKGLYSLVNIGLGGIGYVGGFLAIAGGVIAILAAPVILPLVAIGGGIEIAGGITAMVAGGIEFAGGFSNDPEVNEKTASLPSNLGGLAAYAIGGKSLQPYGELLGGGHEVLNDAGEMIQEGLSLKKVFTTGDSTIETINSANEIAGQFSDASGGGTLFGNGVGNAVGLVQSAVSTLAGEGYSYVSVSVTLDANGNVTGVSITVNDNSGSGTAGDQGSAGDPANDGFLPDIKPPLEPPTQYITR
jgi:RHS repeat-associated protein